MTPTRPENLDPALSLITGLHDGNQFPVFILWHVNNLIDPLIGLGQPKFPPPPPSLAHLTFGSSRKFINVCNFDFTGLCSLPKLPILKCFYYKLQINSATFCYSLCIALKKTVGAARHLNTDDHT